MICRSKSLELQETHSKVNRDTMRVFFSYLAGPPYLINTSMSVTCLCAEIRGESNPQTGALFSVPYG